MLSFGRGWGIVAEDGTLAASTVSLPYGGGFAWVAMVLVLPEHRRKGYATQLLRKALEENERSGLVSLLDATPAGHEVYVQEGFRDFWGFKRFACQRPQAGGPVSGIQSLEDWSQVLSLDLVAFGGSREVVLRNLAARQPKLALMAKRGGEAAGFILAREGREALQIGPLVAKDSRTAQDLLAAALGRVEGPVYLDIADHAASLQQWVLERGFAVQRPFTRMAHGSRGYAPGDASLVYCPAGPELG